MAKHTVGKEMANNGGNCPGCGLIMSIREGAEQGMCNDCQQGQGLGKVKEGSN